MAEVCTKVRPDPRQHGDLKARIPFCALKPLHFSPTSPSGGPPWLEMHGRECLAAVQWRHALTQTEGGEQKKNLRFIGSSRPRRGYRCVRKSVLYSVDSTRRMRSGRSWPPDERLLQVCSGYYRDCRSSAARTLSEAHAASPKIPDAAREAGENTSRRRSITRGGDEAITGQGGVAAAPFERTDTNAASGLREDRASRKAYEQALRP